MHPSSQLLDRSGEHPPASRWEATGLCARCPAVLDLVHGLPAQRVQLDREGSDLLAAQPPLAGLDRLLVPRAAPRPHQPPPSPEDVIAPVEPVTDPGRIHGRLLLGVEPAAHVLRERARIAAGSAAAAGPDWPGWPVRACRQGSR